MADLPDDLRQALTTAVSGAVDAALTASVGRLIDQYRSGAVPRSPILRSAAEAAAYAVYRMPATFMAARSALRQVAAVAPEFAPRTQLDLGGGTGAAVWAATGVWPTLAAVTVVEQSAEAIALGRRLAGSGAAPALRSATWLTSALDTADLPPADLVTVSYVLGELPPDAQASLVSAAATGGGAVALIEPGTPAGYERILAARQVLLDRGLGIVAPCPHAAPCPLPTGRDWCHSAARVNRSGAHRFAKSGTLGYEDEKFSYVVAMPAPAPHAAGRVLRHPVQRKGLVALRVCTAAGTAEQVIVSKRQGPLYRASRDVAWGDAWPPGGGPAEVSP
jgi:ribosomal protein RSM22 (predicted rRNA methylase)